MTSRLHDRRYFTNVATIAFGVPAVVAFLWMFGSYGGLGFWLFLSVVALACGRIWAYLMWFVFKAVYDIDESKTDVGSEKQSGTEGDK